MKLSEIPGSIIFKIRLARLSAEEVGVYGNWEPEFGLKFSGAWGFLFDFEVTPLGLRGLGFRGLGFRVLGFRV